jgi:histidinol-phosphate aminotransferase
MTAVPAPLPKLANLPVYRPGKSAAATMAEHGLSYAAKLSSNENPFAPIESVVAAVVAAARDINRYPDSRAQALRDALAAMLGVDVARVGLGAGSSGVLLQVLNAYAGPGDEVVFGWRSFEAYPIFTRTMGATDVMVPLRNQQIDLEGLAAAVTERTKMILVANPNNPTGTVWGIDELRAFLDSVPTRVLVVLDEAYLEFADEHEAADGVRAFADRPNVLVSRTLSKAYGLAGLRLGYAVAHPDVIEAVDKVMAPFAITNVAQAAALAALGEREELARRVALLRSERDRLVAATRALGYDVPESRANLVWLPVGEATTALFDHFERNGVVTRAFAGEGIRISVGTVVLRALEGFH